MSKAIDELREHFNQRPVPNSKVLMDERDRVNAMIDAVEAENEMLLELIADVHEALCADKAGMFHKLTLASIEDEMRELGIEVEE